MTLMNILLVDDHALFAKSLEIALNDYLEIESFQSTQNTNSLVDLIHAKHIDIVLMDINLGKLSNTDGLTLAAELLKLNQKIKIVILTGYDLPVYRFEAKKMGVSGFLNKNIEPDNLVASLLLRHHGGHYFPTDNKSVFIEELTDTEKQILQLLCNGEKRKDIAKELLISERTLSNHLQHLFEKLDVSSALGAITKGIQLGYIAAY
ncbi:MAG: response regulator transcription factor [Lachnospiraceae bacterium]|nr:response regulator transcription factor [Lachnospiraceae bacterium]